MKQFLFTPIVCLNIFIYVSMIQLLSIAIAETYFVATTGNDSNEGSISAPWRTIEYAWKNSGGGDIVVIRGGRYSENQIWLAAGRQGAGIENSFWTLKNYPGETCVFTDTRFIIDDDYVRIQGFQLTGTSFFQAVCWNGLHEHIELIDNDISGSPTVPIYFIANKGLVEENYIHPTSAIHGIYVMHGDSNVIKNNHVTGVIKYGIHIYDEKKYHHPTKITNLVVENNTVDRSQSRSGIIISAGESIDYSIEIEGVVLRNNIVKNNKEDGITIRYYGMVRNVNIINNTIYGNKSYGLSISAKDIEGISVKNNIFSSNGSHISISSSLVTFVISHNLYWQPALINAPVEDSYAVCKNPLFVNTEKGNFHLRKDSPAINAGEDLGISYLDAAPDLGAFEFSPSSTSPKEVEK